MKSVEFTLLLLPLAFMLHEYEEIIMFRSWLTRHRAEIEQRFPQVAKLLTRQKVFDYSTATFALGTAHEFILLCLIVLYAIGSGNYQWWFAALVGHSLHLVAHLAQWAVYGKYVPVLLTTLLTLPYCGYAFAQFVKADLLSPEQMIAWGIVGILLTAISLGSAFYLMSQFHRWEYKKK